MPLRIPFYEGWEENIIYQIQDAFEANYGTPKVLNAHQVLSRYPPTVPIIYAMPLVPQSRGFIDLIDWDSVRPELVRGCLHHTYFTCTFPTANLDYLS